MRGLGLYLVFIFAFEGHASKCSTVNIKYKFCHEDWVSESISKAMVTTLDNKPLQTNLWQKSYSKNDTLYIILEVRNDDAIDELSQLPGELKNEGMEEILGSDYSPYFAYLYHSYVLWKAKGTGGVKGEKCANEILYGKSEY